MGRPPNHPLTVAEAKAQLRAVTRPGGAFYGALDAGVGGNFGHAAEVLRRHPYAATAAAVLAGALVARSPDLQRALLLTLVGRDR